MLKDFLIKQSIEEVYVLSILTIAFVAIFAFAFAFGAYLIVPDFKERSSSIAAKFLLSIAVIFLSILSILFFAESVSQTRDLIEMHSLVDRKTEEVYNVTKTSNQLIFNRRVDNSRFIKDLSSTITNETDKQYTFVIRNHVYQINKSVVTEK